jgi:linoleoyl-CoA desaturase
MATETSRAAVVDFFPEMRRKVNGYFISNGISRYANATFYLKALLYFSAMIGGYCFLLIRGDQSLIDLWLGYMLYLVSTGLLVITVAHDGSHNAVSKKKIINSILATTWNLLGMSRRIWEAKHHQSHHIHTNLPHQDLDIMENKILRFSPEYTWRPWHRYQHLYAPLVYLLFGPFQIFIKDFMLYYSDKFKIRDKHLNSPTFPFRLILTKITFVSISFIIPMAFIETTFTSMVVIYMLAISVTGFLLLLILAVPHLNETGVWGGEGIEVRSQREWAWVQLKTTVDSSPESVVLSWITGGLNTHLAHHLFPHICHIHYRSITRIIKTELEQKGLAYYGVPAWNLLVSHLKLLQRLGAPVNAPSANSPLDLVRQLSSVN